MFQISLKAARVNANKTQAEVADLLHISKSTIVNWESGTTSPPADKLRKLCEMYECPLDLIFLPDTLLKVEEA